MIEKFIHRFKEFDTAKKIVATFLLIGLVLIFLISIMILTNSMFVIFKNFSFDKLLDFESIMQAFIGVIFLIVPVFIFLDW